MKSVETLSAQKTEQRHLTLAQGIVEFIRKYGGTRGVSFRDIHLGGIRTGFINPGTRSEDIVAEIHRRMDAGDIVRDNGNFRLHQPNEPVCKID